MASLLAACAPAARRPALPPAAPAAANPPQPRIYIPLISKGFQHQFWQAVKAGAEKAAKDMKVKITFEGPETEALVDKQIEMLSAALAKNPKCLASPPWTARRDPAAEEGQGREIPVIGFDSGVDSDIPVTTASTDNMAAAGLAADKMAELIGKAGEVAVIVHDQTSAPASTAAMASSTG